MHSHRKLSKELIDLEKDLFNLPLTKTNIEEKRTRKKCNHSEIPDQETTPADPNIDVVATKCKKTVITDKDDVVEQHRPKSMRRKGKSRGLSKELEDLKLDLEPFAAKQEPHRATNKRKYTEIFETNDHMIKMKTRK